MEEKLRTLKDLIRYSGAYTGRFVCDELKAEAVKWVKANIIEREKYTYEDRSEFTGLIDGFIKFFNLTEEDLK